VYHILYHSFMTTMLSLRLSTDQEKRLTALAARRGMTRSEWLRVAIEQQLAAADASTDSHAIYLELTAPLANLPGSGRGDAARQHSRALKSKLHASRRR
jgi:Ribbon-helix-helix protein, copG family